jgi:hypothetical protein
MLAGTEAAVGAYTSDSSQPVPVLIAAQLNVFVVVLQPAGSALKSEVTVNALAGFMSLVVKTTVTGLLLPVSTASDAELGVPTIVSSVNAR